MTHPIVASARSWIGTRFHHQGRVKKTTSHHGGVDCLGLLVGVARELELHGTGGALIVQCDETNYSHQPDTKKLHDTLARIMCKMPVSQAQAGDVVLLRIDEHPQHLAIVSDAAEGLGLIHAYAPARRVVEHALDVWWRERIEAVFRVC